jgi:hypothetical protein
MTIKLDKIPLTLKDSHLEVIQRNKKSYIRANDQNWRSNLNNDNYESWLSDFHSNGSFGIFLNNDLIGEVLFYNKDNKVYFGMWIDVNLIGQGLGSEIIKLITFKKDVYVEFLLSNQRVINLLTKNNIKYNECGLMGEAKIN